jgi:hypothetical protein
VTPCGLVDTFKTPILSETFSQRAQGQRQVWLTENSSPSVSLQNQETKHSANKATPDTPKQCQEHRTTKLTEFSDVFFPF